MPHFANPKSLEVEDYLLRLYFGFEQPYLSGAILAAYGDLNRTLHGIARFDPSGKLRAEGVAFLVQALPKAPSLASS